MGEENRAELLKDVSPWRRLGEFIGKNTTPELLRHVEFFLNRGTGGMERMSPSMYQELLDGLDTGLRENSQISKESRKEYLSRMEPKPPV